jgi:voltage-gated potassium channel
MSDAGSARAAILRAFMARHIVLDLERYAREVVANPLRRLYLALSALLLLILVGTVGYVMLLGVTVVDAVYQTVITIATVGFSEVAPFTPLARVFTIFLILSGVGITAWAATAAVEVMLGQYFWANVRRRKMEETLLSIRDHFIIGGYGRMGRQIVRDLRARGERFVVIDRNGPGLEELVEQNIPFVAGDATQDEVLLNAGIERARGFVAAIGDDADNVVAVLTARGLNPTIQIVARGTTEVTESKLRRAGADRVVSPYAIGGHRLALAMLQPAVDDFMNRLFNLDQFDVDVGEVPVQAGSAFDGRTLAECDFRRRWGLTVIAIRSTSGEFAFSPDSEHRVAPSEVLIVIGSPKAILAIQDARA